MRSSPTASFFLLCTSAVIAACSAEGERHASLGAALSTGDVRVSVGSPASPFSRNKQNEPTIAVNPLDATILVAASNDEIDIAPCSGSDCSFTPGVGVSGVYFSFDAGKSWTQPTYSGWSARTGIAQVGPVGTLPWFYENGLVSDGDPVLAFGPRRGGDGTFAWSNGVRLYYASLAANFSSSRTDAAFKGYESVVVSRSDDLRGAASGSASAWMPPVVVTTRLSNVTFSDKESVWADNAASSPYFGNVYLCNMSFRSNTSTGSSGAPLLFSRSIDSGDTWSAPNQLTPATNNSHSLGRQGCVVRTDSKGTVYVIWEGADNGTAAHLMTRSFDGGVTFEQTRTVAHITDVGVYDATQGDIVMDGIAGVRTDSFPSVDIANGAPTGAGATDSVVLAWADGALGVNHERALAQLSTDRGISWTAPINAAEATDRPTTPAVAISPNGSDVYVAYGALVDPYRTDTTSTRRFQGVVRHATGGLSSLTTLHRGAIGDTRGSSTNSLSDGFMGDYNGVAATNVGAFAVFNDVRNATVCPSVDAYRASELTASTLPKPAPLVDCAAGFGNSDIYGFAYAK